MQALPSRPALAELIDEANAVCLTLALGFAHRRYDNRVAVVYVSRHGLATHVIEPDEVPEVLQPETPGVLHVDPALLATPAFLATEWQLGFFGVRGLISAPMAGVERATRVWLGQADSKAPGPVERAGVERIAASAARLFGEELSGAERLERQRRVARAGALLQEMPDGLPMRELFTRLSAAAKEVLPHDVLRLRQVSRDMTTATVFAVSEHGPVAASPLSHGYPVQVLRAWEYSIVDDLQCHPMESEELLAKQGARSLLRCAIRSSDRTAIGGLSFLSFAPAAYSTTDLYVARRLAHDVGPALAAHAVAAPARR